MVCVGHGDNFMFVDNAYFTGATYYYSCKFCGYGGERGIKETLLKTKPIVKLADVQIDDANNN